MRSLKTMCGALLGLMLGLSATFAPLAAQQPRQDEWTSAVGKMLKMQEGLSKEGIELMTHLGPVFAHLELSFNKLAYDPVWVKATADTYIPLVKTLMRSKDAAQYRPALAATLKYEKVHRHTPSASLRHLIADHARLCNKVDQTDAEEAACVQHAVHAAYVTEYGAAAGVKDDAGFVIVSMLHDQKVTPELRATYVAAFDAYFAMVREATKS